MVGVWEGVHVVGTVEEVRLSATAPFEKSDSDTLLIEDLSRPCQSSLRPEAGHGAPSRWFELVVAGKLALVTPPVHAANVLLGNVQCQLT